MASPHHTLFDPFLSTQMASLVAWARWQNTESIKVTVQGRLRDLLQSVQKHSPLYGRILKGRNLATLSLQDLPIMSKADLMAQFSDWVADPNLRLSDLRAFLNDPTQIGSAYQERYLLWESSGSNGEPGVFVQDARAMAVFDALEFWRRPNLQPLRRLRDPLGRRESIAFVGAIDGHYAGSVTLARLARLQPAMASHIHRLSFMQPMEDLVAQLQACQPTVLATYPSLANLLMDEQEAGRLNIAPTEVWLGGESLNPNTQARLQETWHSPFANTYGCSEFLSLATSCTHGHLHLNHDWAILESVDDQGRPVPAGETGATTLLTNLCNHVQPIIRYDLGDRITVRPEPCPCGSPFPVIEVQGRCSRNLYVEGGQHESIGLSPLALSTLLEESGLVQYQVHQATPRKLTLRIPQHDADHALLAKRAATRLRAYLKQQGASHVSLGVQAGTPLFVSRSGKTPQFVHAGQI